MKSLFFLSVLVCLYSFLEPVGNAASSYPVASYHPRIIINRLKAGYTACSGIAFFQNSIRESDFHNYTTAYEAAFVMTGLALYGEDPAGLEMLQRGWGMISEGYPFDPTGFGETVTFRLKS